MFCSSITAWGLIKPPSETPHVQLTAVSGATRAIDVAKGTAWAAICVKLRDTDSSSILAVSGPQLTQVNVASGLLPHDNPNNPAGSQYLLLMHGLRQPHQRGCWARAWQLGTATPATTASRNHGSFDALLCASKKKTAHAFATNQADSSHNVRANAVRCVRVLALSVN